MFGLFLLCITKYNTYITGAEEKMVGGEEVLVRVVVKAHLLYIFCIKGLFCSGNTDLFWIFQLTKLFPISRPLSLGVEDSPFPSLCCLILPSQLLLPLEAAPSATDRIR